MVDSAHTCALLSAQAPEMHRASGYDGFHADSWSLGAVLLDVTCGMAPESKLKASAEAYAFADFSRVRSISFDNSESSMSPRKLPSRFTLPADDQSPVVCVRIGTHSASFQGV